MPDTATATIVDAPANVMTADLYDVRAGHEWGEFFVRVRPPKEKEHGGKKYWQYAATWVCNSSYGVFGYYWSHMGSPFHEFASTIGIDYLLSKISRTEILPELVEKAVRKQILECRYERNCTKDQAREAWEEIEMLSSEYSGETLLMKVYESEEMRPISDDWSEGSYHGHPPDAVEFAKTLWPEFAKQLRERAAS